LEERASRSASLEAKDLTIYPESAAGETLFKARRAAP
jgi:hypothetical protein